MSPAKIYKNNGVVFERQFASIKTSINDNSWIIFCFGWKSDTSLATQTKGFKAGDRLFFVGKGWFNIKNGGKCKKVWAVFGKS